MSADAHVRRTAEDYAEVFASDLPTGPAWPRDPDTILMRVVDGLTKAWARVDGRIDDLLVRESDPRSTFEMLGDWEIAFGLPDTCDPILPTIEDRQLALVAKIATEGGQSRAFFIQQAETLGYKISIYEYAPYLCGVSECGETRTDGTLVVTFAEAGVMEAGVDPICSITQTGGDEWRWECGPSGNPASTGLTDIRYFWKVKVSGSRLSWFRGGSGEAGRDHHCEIALADDLECMFRRLKPAHTEVIFDYSSIDATGAGVLDASRSGTSLLPFLLLF